MPGYAGLFMTAFFSQIMAGDVSIPLATGLGLLVCVLTVVVIVFAGDPTTEV